MNIKRVFLLHEKFQPAAASPPGRERDSDREREREEGGGGGDL